MANPVPPSQSQPRADARRNAPPGEDPGTLTDEEYLSVGGPDALDAATPGDERTDASVDSMPEAHPDSPPPSQRSTPGEDPERAGADPQR